MSTERSNAMAESIFGERLNEGIFRAIEDALSRLADRDLSPDKLQAAVSAPPTQFSTYATWWIRQAVTRALADQARTI